MVFYLACLGVLKGLGNTLHTWELLGTYIEVWARMKIERPIEALARLVDKNHLHEVNPKRFRKVAIYS